MRYLTQIVFLFFISAVSQAQINELGVFVGGSNFIGDVGATNYISPNHFAVGGIYKWNRSTRHSYRFSAIYSKLENKDSYSDDPRRIERGYEFDNSIIELSAGMEFTFFDWDLHNGKKQGTPYLYTGATMAFHDNYYFTRAGEYTYEDTSSIAYGIPMALGYKFTLTTHLILGAEIGARYTFSDELDGSVPDSKENIESLSFGNKNNNDWYVFSGITLTYTFGRNPCFCL